jgi:hypothetical protein
MTCTDTSFTPFPDPPRLAAAPVHVRLLLQFDEMRVRDTPVAVQIAWAVTPQTLEITLPCPQTTARPRPIAIAHTDHRLAQLDKLRVVDTVVAGSRWVNARGTDWVALSDIGLTGGLLPVCLALACPAVVSVRMVRTGFALLLVGPLAADVAG